jgi:hypothetical protein
MPSIDDILAPGRAFEALLRRASRGHRQAWQRLLQCTPLLIDAESRWLYPALLHRQPGGARHAWLLPFSSEHEQILELIDYLAHSPSGRADPMCRSAQSLMLRHIRSERQWMAQALRGHLRLDDSALERFVMRCRPLVDAARELGALASPTGPAIGAATAVLKPGRP